MCMPLTGSSLSVHHAASDHAHGYGFMLFIIVLGVVEFSLDSMVRNGTGMKRRSISRASRFPSWFSLHSLPGSA